MLRIIGKNSDDKGTQLEQIVSQMLQRSGYENIHLNEVTAGSAEYDVTADLTLPSIAGQEGQRLRVVGECKARKDLANMNDWQKFLGKVFLERATKRKAVHGVFVSASGFNGNVAGSFAQLKEVSEGDTIRLFGDQDIARFLMEEYDVLPLQAVAASLPRFTERSASNIELCYYGRHCYWLITFSARAGVFGPEYTLLSDRGDPLKAVDAIDLKPLIGGSATSSETSGMYIDLYEEAEAKRRSDYVLKIVVAHLMVAWGSDQGVLASDVADEVIKPDAKEIEVAVSRLREQGLIESSKDGAGFSLVRDSLCDDPMLIDCAINEATQLGKTTRCKVAADILRMWLSGSIPIPALYQGLSSTFYALHVDAALLDECLTLQGGLTLLDEDKAASLRFIQLSPRALMRALHPIGMIVQHRVNQPGAAELPEVNELDRQIFLREIATAAQEDYLGNIMPPWFIQQGIAEFEETNSFSIKATNPPAITITSRIRRAARTSNTSLGFVHLISIGNQPEPWDEVWKGRSDVNLVFDEVQEGSAIGSTEIGSGGTHRLI